MKRLRAERVRIWMLGFLIVPGVRLVALEVTDGPGGGGPLPSAVRNVVLYALGAVILTALCRPLGHVRRGLSPEDANAGGAIAWHLFVDRVRTSFFWFFAIPGVRFAAAELRKGGADGLAAFDFRGLLVCVLVATIVVSVYRPAVASARSTETFRKRRAVSGKSGPETG